MREHVSPALEAQGYSVVTKARYRLPRWLELALLAAKYATDEPRPGIVIVRENSTGNLRAYLPLELLERWLAAPQEETP